MTVAFPWPFGTDSRERGAGLIEVVIATLILTLVSLALVEFFAKGRIWFDQEERKRVATALAQEALERTTAAPYAEIASWQELRRISSLPYTINVTVRTDVPEVGLKTIQAVVSWPATPTAARNVSLATMAYAS